MADLSFELTLSSSLSPDTSIGPTTEANTNVERTGRPSHPPRQASYSKRHASFDTPREVPFASHPPLSASAHTTHPSPHSFFSRTSSGATITASASRPLSPKPTPQAALHSDSKQPDDGLEASRAREKDRDREEQARLRQGVILLPSSNDAVSPDGMAGSYASSSTYNKHFSDSGCNAPLIATSPASSSHNQHSEEVWNSEFLRPPLLAQRGRWLDYTQVEHERTLRAQNSPYMADREDRSELHAPIASRPSSTASLPLPHHMPYFALPGASSTTNHGTSLSKVVEQVQSEFNQTAQNGARPNSDSDSPMSISSASPDQGWSQRRHSSPRVNDPSSLFEAADRHSRGYTRSSLAGSVSTMSTSSASNSETSMASTASSSLPPPTPPIIHTPPPRPYSEGKLEPLDDMKNLNRQSAPHEPFLSHAPPSADTEIHVETVDVEYRLIVRLPGYSPDAIMLTTRRRRTLNIAADSWKPGGGHFERRITFGYDADLTRVRAQFDGEHLRVIIPRKTFASGWFGFTQSE